jgi:N-acetylglucosaminyldiphosphoundecaprenol N-acetyl-beta-D-mannosaminyltransferase
MRQRQVVGTSFDFISYEDVFERIETWRQMGRREYVAFTPPYTVMLSMRDSRLADANSGAGLILPDGIGIILAAKILGYANRGRVSGPTFMLKACDWGRRCGYRHYFYGGAPGTPDRLRDRLSARYPGLHVVGACAPPFRTLSDEEDQAMVRTINAARPDIVWVGLGSPKQEVWMCEHAGKIEAAALVGVGAAFDFHSGQAKWAPASIRRLGLEWAYRLAHEPRRLWRRSAESPRFLLHVIRQRLGTSPSSPSPDMPLRKDKTAVDRDWSCARTPSVRNGFSVDVEEWFHILDTPQAPPQETWPFLETRVEQNLDRLLELLDHHGVHATFFWLGWVAERHQSLVRRCSNAGHEIASHGYSHVVPQEMGQKGFLDDIVRAKRILEDVVGRRVDGFRVPGFGVNGKTPWVFRLIREAGYEYDSSVFLASRDYHRMTDKRSLPYVIPTEFGPLLEIPLPAVSVFGHRLFMFGGGYLRLAPKRLIKWGIEQLHAVGAPLIVYVHPREVDTDHPYLPLNPIRHFRYYVNLRSTMPKLAWMCRRYDFLPMGELAREARLAARAT